jgi:hypothetical protein
MNKIEPLKSERIHETEKFLLENSKERRRGMKTVANHVDSHESGRTQNGACSGVHRFLLKPSLASHLHFCFRQLCRHIYNIFSLIVNKCSHTELMFTQQKNSGWTGKFILLCKRFQQANDSPSQDLLKPQIMLLARV